MKVYMVLFDWSTTDDEGIEIELFDSYEKATTRFDAIIDDEQNPDISWVGDGVFDENGDVCDDYELDTNCGEIPNDGIEHELWWHLVDKSDWNRHDFLEVRIVEVK